VLIRAFSAKGNPYLRSLRFRRRRRGAALEVVERAAQSLLRITFGKVICFRTLMKNAEIFRTFFSRLKNTAP
jgi:hypothetical protein